MASKLALLVLALLACAGLGAQDVQRPPAIFLVAAKSLQDPNFRETVVLVTQHGGRGPIGVVVNRPTQTTLARVFPDHPRLESQGARLHFGGPVAPQALVFLYRGAARRNEAIEVLEGVQMSLNASLLSELLERDPPLRDLRVFAGYSGWAPGQLEHEIARGDWYLAEADAATLFDKDPETIWPDLLRRASARRIRSDAEPHPGSLLRLAAASVPSALSGRWLTDGPPAPPRR